MDAKKKAKFVKPKHFNDTKAHAFYLKSIVGLGIYIVVVGAMCYQYDLARPNRFIKNNPLTRYWDSEENKMRMARYLGFIPFDSTYSEKPAHSLRNEE